MPFCSNVDHRIREATTLAPSVGNFTFYFDSVTSKDGNTFTKSFISGRGEDDNFEWRLAIERRQLASERQLKALLQETERLREENDVLRIQLQHQGLLDVNVRGAK
ncbi:hypothetical protein CK203_070426 [Vitis vinifera]|uniref:Uncharacterized protein n=1 Tax=Vitis vinifera TaxID=29760 RepID=A0A438FAJ2_VITVI|nr:hypothetical protein CK203_070426 [Vitis vinifera]